MKDNKIISADYFTRMNEVLDLSWMILKSQFLNGRHEINSEAPFQHHFAQIIRSVGELYSINSDDLFKVDLETKVVDIRTKTKFYDISCQYYGKIKCAIELKFKLKRQGAEDWGRIDSYVDIESLELTTGNQFDFGKFYMITDDDLYVKKSKRGSGTIYCMHDGYTSQKNKTLNSPTNKGREHVFVKLQNQYNFEWEQLNDWFFLDLLIKTK
jgi:hypothetical protein